MAPLATPPPPNGLGAIQRAAKANGIGWQAPAAIASYESGLNPSSVGDQGTSFGLFQLHQGGALPAGTNPALAKNPDWNANFAARQIKALGIQGLPVEQQIAQISRRFERPADPATEISRATDYYRTHYAGAGLASQNSPAPLPNAPVEGAGSVPQGLPQLSLQRSFTLGNQQAQRAQDALGQISGQDVTVPAPNFSKLLANTGSSQTVAPHQIVPLTGPTPTHLDAQGQKAVELAKHYLGTKYVFGGASPKTGFDCSGLLQYVWGKNGVQIPRTSEQQWHAGTAVPKGQIQPGDAVFFVHPGGDVGHVGMAIGNGQYIESPHTGDVIKIAQLSTASNFIGARRFA